MKKNSTLRGKKRLFLLFSLLLVSFSPPIALDVPTQNLSLSMKNASMKEIMREIKRVSQYDFIVSDSDVSGMPRKTVSFTNATIDEVLSKCFEGTGLTYTIDDATIVIIKNAQQPQNRSAVSGRVTDSGNRPMAGVTVQVKNTRTGVATDLNGVYKLNIPEGGEVTLVFSFIGMAPREIAVPATQSTLNVVMREASVEIQDVVVTGIFDKAKESYTGAARTITKQELIQFQGRNLIATLGNIDPAFKIIQNNEWGSNPNRLPEVQIRGASNLSNIGEISDEANAALNTPLIIMDGFETTLQRLMDLDENEVTSVTILKDGAATALYGSRGANGVIALTTRQPQAGGLRFYYKGDLKIEAPDLTEYDILNAREKFELENRAGMYNVSNHEPSVAVAVQQYRSDVWRQILEGVDTDWMSKPLRVGIGQNHNLRIEGGDETFRYSLSAQYNNSEGVMKGSSRDNFNGGLNLTYYRSKLIFRNNLTVGYNEAVNSKYGSFSDYVKLNPYWKPYDDDGSVVKTFTPYNPQYWAQNGTFSGAYTNPLYNTTLNTFDKSDYVNITNNFSIEWIPVSDLILRGQAGITSQIGSSDVFKPAGHTDFANYTGSDIFRKGSYDYSDSRTFNYSVSFSANYNKLFADKHRLYAGLNLDATQNRNRIYTFSAEGFPNENIDFLPMALQYAQNSSPGGGEQQVRRVGVVGNVNYGFMERYYVDASFRVDGNSQYGSDKRYGTFWSTGLGWNVHQENFMRDLSFINRLKFRASFGVTGSPLSDAYSSQSTYRYYNDDNYRGWIGAYQIALGNSSLKWQQTDKYNLGMELAMFNDILNLQAEYYLTKTDGLISALELPYSNGFTSYQANVGAFENRGFELSAIVWLLRDNTRDIQWSMKGNITYATDKITKLSEALKAEIEKIANLWGSTPNTIYREGDSQNTIYVVRSLGIDPSTGKELYLNKDGEVTYTWRASDRVAAGVDYPTYKGNFSTMFRYKDFTFNASFGFFWGSKQYNQTLIDRVENANKLMNVDRRVLADRWVQPGDRTFFRGLTEIGTVNYSSRFVQDNAAFYCQTIGMQYTFRDRKWMNKSGMSALTLSANTGELFYWTTIRQERGISYPFSRQFSFSVSALF